MQCLAEYLNYASASAALVTAILWGIAASVETPENIFIETNVIESAYDNSTAAFSDSSDLTKLANALLRQSRWNKYAAAFAALSAAFLATALLVGAPQNCCTGKPEKVLTEQRP